MQPTHEINATAMLMMALELSGKKWKLAASDGRRQHPVLHNADAPALGGRIEQVVQRIERLRQQWGLPADCRVVVLYEAGQDGFWIARALQQRGVQVLVVDAASVPVSRQSRRAKTDRLDVVLLLETLQRWLRGERGQIRMVHIPQAEVEARRQLVRERGELQKEIGQHRDRIRKLLLTQGCRDELQGDVAARLAGGQLRCWDGAALPEELRERLERECERWQLAQRQFAELEAALLQQLPEPVRLRVKQLARLKGVGWVGAVRLVLELFWRDFHNRRQVGSCVGLVAQPHDSGASRVDQGISKQGNRRVRALLIEMAWMWLRYQPGSAMAQWFAARTAGNAANKRGKRIAIVAVARRLAIALWRYLDDGVLPQGAQLKQA